MRQTKVLLRFAAVGGLLVTLAECAPEPGARDKAFDETPAATAESSPDAASEAQDPLPTFAEPIVLYVEATPEDLAAAKARMGEEDFSVMADDLMWYRATAYEFLEKNGLPVRTVSGKNPLTFLVNGQAQQLDLTGHTTLDVIVLYDTNREPHVIAPINVDLALAYFQKN